VNVRNVKTSKKKLEEDRRQTALQIGQEKEKSRYLAQLELEREQETKRKLVDERRNIERSYSGKKKF